MLLKSLLGFHEKDGLHEQDSFPLPYLPVSAWQKTQPYLPGRRNEAAHLHIHIETVP